MRLRCAWIGGWAVPTTYMVQAVERVFPHCEHTVYLPIQTAIPQVISGDFDHVIGYSLGSLLVLNSIDQFLPQTNIVLLAPIFNFRQEAQMGSRVTTTQLKYMQRWLQREPVAAINDFYTRAGLNIAEQTQLPYPLEDLAWGLDALLTLQAPLAAARACTCVIGAQDTLLDCRYIQQVRLQLPDTKIMIETCNHDIASILKSSALQTHLV